MPEIIRIPSHNVYPQEPLNQSVQYSYDPRLDKGLRPGVNQEWNRADNQSWYEQFGMGIASRSLSIGTKVVSGLGSVGTALAVPFSNYTTADIWDNPLTNWGNEADQKLQTIFPVFRSKDYSTSGLLGKMATSSFWASDAMDAIAFAASAYFPGTIISKGLGALGKIAESGEIGSSMFKYLNRIGVTQNRANLLLSTAYNTVAEAAAEAYQTQNELETIYLQQGYNPKEAKEKASHNAKEVFTSNLGILAVPNFIQNQFFHGSWGDKMKLARKAAIESKGAASAGDFLGSRWSKVLEGIASEGLWEENVQAAVQQYERAIGMGIDNKDEGGVSQVVDNMYANIKGLVGSFLPNNPQSANEQEAAISIFLGGLLGAGFGLMSHRQERLDYEKLVANENEAYKKFFTDIIPAADKVLNNNAKAVYKTNGTKTVKIGDQDVEVPNYVMDKDNNPVIDVDKLHNLVFNSFADAKNWSIESTAVLNNNQKLSAFNKEIALASYAYNLGTNSNYYSTKDIKELLDNYAENATKEADSLGINTQAPENIQKIKDYLDQLETITNKHVAANDANDPEKYTFGKLLAKTEFYLAAKQNAINQLRNLSKDAKGLDNLQKDLDEHLNLLTNEKGKIKSIYDARLKNVYQISLEIEKLNNKKDKTEEDSNRLKELKYRYIEEQFIYGTYAANQAGARGNPIGLNSINLVKTTPGSIDSHQYKQGKSWISARQADQALADNNLPEAVKNFVEITNPVSDIDLVALGESITQKLDSEQNRIAQTTQTAVNALGTISLFENSGISADSGLSLEEFADENGVDIDELAKNLQDLGIDANAATPINEEFMSSIDAVSKNLDGLAADIQRGQAEFQGLALAKEKVNNVFNTIDDNVARHKVLLNASNQEEFLKKEFFDSNIKDPAEAFVKHANTFPDLIDEGSRIETLNHLDNLRIAEAAYENRKDANNPADYVLKNTKKLREELEKRILPLINKKLEDREAAQVESNRLQVSNIVAHLNSYEQLPSEYKELLKTVKTYDGIEAILFNLRNELSAQQRGDLAGHLRATIQQLTKELFEKIPTQDYSKGVVSSLKANLVGQNEWYAKMPHQMLPFIVKLILNDELEQDVTQHELLHKYLADLDTFSFALALPSYSALSETKRQLINAALVMHFKVLAATKLIFNLQESTLDHSKLIDLKADLTTPPSIQQNIVLTDLLNYLSSKVDTKDFGNYFLIDGIAGSGKTHIIGKYGLSLWAALNGKSVTDNTYAFSKTSRTSANINESVYGSNQQKTFEGFLNLSDNELAKLDIILIDEIYTFTDDDIQAINTKIADFNSRREKPHIPKIICLGDKSQKGSGDTLVIRSNLAINTKSTIPLTSTYRTNVNAISSFSKNYRLRAVPITNSVATLNVSKEDFISHPAAAYGVIALSETDLIKAINSASPRSRVLLVSNEIQARAYANLPIDVIPVGAAQGYQWDEVYALLDPELLGSTTFEINQGLYTAYSRAKSLLAIVDSSTNNTLPSEGLNSDLSQAEKVLEQNKNNFETSVNEAKRIFKKELGGEAITRQDLVPEDFKTDDAPETDPGVVMQASFDEYESPVITVVTRPKTEKTIKGGKHILRFPKNSNLTPILKSDNSGKAIYLAKYDLNSEGIIVRAKSGDNELHYVLAPYSQDSSKWIVLGTLGNSDYEASENLTAALKKTTGFVPLASIDEYSPFSLDAKDAIITKFNLNDVKELKTLQLPHYLDNPDPIESAIINFHKSFFGYDVDGKRVYPAEVYDEVGNPTKLENDWVIDGKVNWNALKNKVEFRIMTEKEKANVPPGFSVIVGAPYLVIKNPQQRNATKVARRFYIPFQPRPFNKTQPSFQRIIEFRDNVAALESILAKNDVKFKLGSEDFEDMVHWFAKTNFHMEAEASTVFKDGSTKIVRKVASNANQESLSTYLGKNIPVEADALLTKLVLATYGIDQQLVVFNTREEAEQYLADNATIDSNGHWELVTSDISVNTNKPKTHKIIEITTTKAGKFVLNEAIDPDNLDVTRYFQDYKVVSGKGIVQRDLNSLAMANHSIGDLPIRVTLKDTASGSQQRFTRAKSIFSATKALDTDLLLRDPVIVESGWNNAKKDPDQLLTTQLLDYLENKLDPNPEEARKKAKQLIDKYSIYPFSLSLLNLIVGDEMFDENNNHVALRQPLHLSTYERTGINDLGTPESPDFSLDKPETRLAIGSQVMTRFSGMSKTSVEIEIPKLVEKPTALPTTLGELLKSIPTTNVAAIEETKDLLSKLTSKLDIKVIFGAKFVVGDETYENTSLTHLYNNKVEVLLNTPFEQIQKGNIKAIQIVLHELVHAATIQELHQGEQDFINGKETAQATFFKRLSALQKRFNAVIAARGIKRVEVYQATKSKLGVKEFVANLSNPKFREVASQIETVSPKSKSLIREILDAIVELFKAIIGTPSVYDSIKRVVEDFFEKVETTPIVAEDLVPTIDSLKEDITKLLSQIKDAESLPELRGILTYKNGVVTFGKIFNAYSDGLKLNTLTKLRSTLQTRIGNIQFAYYDTPTPDILAVSGAIKSTAPLQILIDNILDTSALSGKAKNLLYSILHKQLINPEIDLVGQLIKSTDKSHTISNLMTVLSYQDKSKLRDSLNIPEEAELAPYLEEHYSELEITKDLKAVQDFLIAQKSGVEQVVGSLEDRAPLIYKAAKDFILNIIRKNKRLESSNADYVRTRVSLRALIDAQVAQPNVADLEQQLDIANKQLGIFALTINTPESQKNYAYYRFNKIPAIENQLLGIKALNTINKATGNRLAYDIYKEIYPSDPFTENDLKEIKQSLNELANIEDTYADRTDEELIEAANISEYIKEFNKSYELTLSEAVKDFLVTINLAGTDKYLSPSLAYIKILQLVSGLEFSPLNKKSTLENVFSQLQQIKSKKELLSDLDYSIAVRLTELVAKTLTPAHNVAGHVTLVSYTLPSGRIQYVGAMSKSAENIQNKSYEELKVDPDILFTRPSELSEELITELSKLTDMSIAKFNALFSRAEAVNVVRGLVNVMASMRETDLYLALRSTSKGYRVKFIRSKSSDITFGIKDEIQNNLQELHSKGNLLSNIIEYQTKLRTSSGKTFAQANSTGTAEEKLFFIKKFFDKILGFHNIKLGLSARSNNEAVITDTTAQIKEFLHVASDLKEFGDDIPLHAVTDKPTAAPEDNSFESFIENADGYLTRFANLATVSSDITRNPSVRTLKGDRYYKWHESSWGFDVFKSLIDSPKDSPINASSGSNTFRQLPAHLFTDLYKHNIFVQSNVFKSKVYSVGEFEGSKNEDINSTTPYSRENYFYFLHRKFVQGFLDGVRQSNGKRYFQFVYLPSDKNKYPLAQIDIIPDSNIIPVISEVLQHLLDKRNWQLNIKNYNNPNQLFRNFRVGKEAIDFLAKRGIEFTQENIKVIAEEINARLEKEAQQLLDVIMSEDIDMKFDIRTNILLSKLKSNGMLNSKHEVKISKDNFKSAERKSLLPALELFVKNNYLNNFFLNQLITGDYQAFSSTEDLVKRYAGIFAPGIVGLVDSNIGMRDTYKTLVLDDTYISTQTNEEVLRSALQVTPEEEAEFQRVLKFFGDAGYDMTDGQGFMLPSRVRDLSKGFERAWYLGAVHKPVHFEVQIKKTSTGATTAIPVYIKYSAVELSDEFLKGVDSPLLYKLRDNLERLGVDEMVFASAVKTGLPLKLDKEGKTFSLTFKDFLNKTPEELAELRALENNSILTLSNRNFRLQHNPATDVNKQVAIYTQLMYFLSAFTNVAESSFGVHPSLKEKADRVYALVGRLIAMGRERFSQKINTSEKLYTFLRKELDGPSSQRILDLLNSGISVNNPLVMKKAIIAIASGMESETVRVKFNGASLVLVSAEGYHFATGEQARDELKYKIREINGVKTLLVDALVPEDLLSPEHLQAVKEKRALFAYGDALAFRIPSTELHSAVAINVVGTIPGKKNNLIIVPKEIVPIHGSDFDVDKLFIVTREFASESDLHILSAETINTYQNNLRQILDTIDGLKEGLDETQRLLLTDYKNALKERVGLFKQLDNIEAAAEQNVLQDQFEEFVTTPQYMSSLGKKVVRIELPDYEKNENKYKTEWGRLNGYYWVAKKQIWIEQNPLVNQLKNLNDIVNEIEAGQTALPVDLVKALKEHTKLVKASKVLTALGTAEIPVGYSKQKEAYVFDPEFVNSLEEELHKLTELKENLNSDLRKALLPSINSSIKKVQSLIEKSIKNEITETMLQVLSAPKNKFRMTTPIAFYVIKNAYKSIPEKLRPQTDYDLSSLNDEFEAYISLSSGQILTGAFANAVKVLTYFTQAGDAPTAEIILAKLNEVRAQIALLDAEKKIELRDLEKQKEELKKELVLQRLATSFSARSQINPAYAFKIGNETYDKLAVQTTDGFNVTEVFDTLINSAIDNLKLGYLNQAHINTQTGSFVIGSIFVGVPLKTITQLLYFPIFNKITSGVSDRVASFITKTRKDYNERLTKLENEILTQAEIDSVLSGNSDMDAQLKAFLIFEKGYKIGEDVRNMASFLDVIRNMKVFAEQLDQVDANLRSNIGRIEEDEAGNLVLIPRADFAFIAPNLFRNNPHVQEAYKSHREIQDLISKHFTLHSEPVRKFAAKINQGLSLRTDDENKNASANEADIRIKLGRYLLSSLVWDSVKDTKPKVNTFKGKNGKEVKITLSIATSFMNKVANKLSMVKNFAAKENIHNRFLDTVYISPEGYISFRGGVNLQAEDLAQISLDFRNLNRFDIESSAVKYDLSATPYYVSELQKDLLVYAVLAYGLEFSGQSFANFIPGHMLRELDAAYNTMLESLDLDRIFEHYRLSYAMQNASRMNFIVKQDRVSSEASEFVELINPDGSKYKERIFYDRKVEKAPRYKEFIKEGFGNDSVVFIRVAENQDHVYYQRVGKAKDIFFTKLPDNLTAYRTQDYFSPSIYTLRYHYIEKDKIYSYQDLRNLGDKEQDYYYIVPDYNYDRTQRKLVKIVKTSEYQTGKYPGYIHTFEEVDPVMLEVKKLKDTNEITKICNLP